MDLDNAKENIQPLACGRNVHQLEVALNAENHEDAQAELATERQAFLDAITNYCGSDPLNLWYEYIIWIEQSYPKSGKDNPLEDELLKCLCQFEESNQYTQDRRMVKLFIKFIDLQDNPPEFCNRLYEKGFGTMVADLYIYWAHYYDACDNFEKAEEVYQKGLNARAEPLDELQQAHTNFGFSMSQRLLHKDKMSRDEFLSTMNERRNALTSLRAHKKKHVGSLRTGFAVKSNNPGRIQQSAGSSRMSTARSNVPVSVFSDQNADPNVKDEADHNHGAESVGAGPSNTSIFGATSKKENVCEPGPWSKAKLGGRKKSVMFSDSTKQCSLGFSIMEDTPESNEIEFHPFQFDEVLYQKGIQLPKNFVTQNEPQTIFDVPIFYVEPPAPNEFPMYDKVRCYPDKNIEISSEEIRAYNWFIKHNVKNSLIEKCEYYWAETHEAGIRLPPNFVNANVKLSNFVSKRYAYSEKDKMEAIMFKPLVLYPDDEEHEICPEERFAEKWNNNELRSQIVNQNATVIEEDDMDVTQVISGRASVYVRRSIMPRKSELITRKSIIPKHRVMPIVVIEKDDDIEMEDDFTAKDNEMEEDNMPSTLQINDPSVKPSTSLAECSHKMTNLRVSSVPSVAKVPIYSDEPKKLNDETNEPKENVQKIQNPINLPNNFQIYSDEGVNDIQTTDNLKKPIEICLDKPEEIVEGAMGSIKNQFEIYTDQTKDIIPREFIVKKSEIKPYEDKENDVFKVPVAPVSVPFIEEPRDERQTDQIIYPFANPNETCSTQTFNFFIKDHLVSTPKAVKIAPNLRKQEQSSMLGVLNKSENKTSDESQQKVVPRQLSMILERSESGASSKSSKSPSSPNTDFEELKDGSTKSSVQSGTDPTAPEIISTHEGNNQTELVGSEETFIPEPSLVNFNNITPMKSILVHNATKFDQPSLMNVQNMLPTVEDEDEILKFFAKSPECGNRFKSKNVSNKYSGSRLLDNTNLNITEYMENIIPPFLNSDKGLGSKANLNQSQVHHSVKVPTLPSTSFSQNGSLANLSLTITESEKEKLRIMKINNEMESPTTDVMFIKKENESNEYIEEEYNESLAHTTLTELLNTNFNPFSDEIHRVLLQTHDFVSYIKTINTCEMVNRVQIREDLKLTIAGQRFIIGKKIGEGRFGVVYYGTSLETGNEFAFKYEEPANCWEYCIALELRTRFNPDLLTAIMDIEYGLIGNNASIFVTKYSRYGTLVDVCNKIKKATARDINEYVVMLITSQLLLIIDHLHGSNIIHGDLKPDNLLLTNPISMEDNNIFLQLIDYGYAIDMNQFDEDQTFMCMDEKVSPHCPDVIDGKPWSFQIDIYGIAEVIHSLLFGKHMVIQKDKNNIWTINHRIPRYINSVWETVFNTLLNIKDSKNLPNLQSLRMMLKEEIASKDFEVKTKMSEVNNILQNPNAYQ